MNAKDERDLTHLLLGARHGNKSATGQLVERLWDELHGLAGHMMRNQPPGHTLQATALVHEAYLRLTDSERLSAGDRSHFLAIAARAMRQILARHAQDRRALKRGGEWGRVSFTGNLVAEGAGEGAAEAPLALDSVLNKLSQLDARQAKIVEMRFFAGMTSAEMAEVLSVSVSTVEREWRMARAWIRAELAEAIES